MNTTVPIPMYTGPSFGGRSLPGIGGRQTSDIHRAAVPKEPSRTKAHPEHPWRPGSSQFVIRQLTAGVPGRMDARS